MHLSESRLLAYLDGELPPHEAAEVEEHLGACAPCRRASVTLRSRSEAVRRLLGSIDVEPPTERVREKLVRARRAVGRRGVAGASGASWWSRRSRLAQAALLLLVLGAVGGLSAALPGSPIRSWLSNGEEAPGGDIADGGPERTAVLGEPLSGSLTVTLDGLRRGDVVEVAWIDDGAPRVRSPSGSRYRVVPGVLSAEVVREPAPGGASAPPVRVTVELPRHLSDVVVETGGGVLLTKRDGSVELPGAVTDSSASVLRFEVGGE